MSRRHCVGSGAPVNFGRRTLPVIPKNRRQQKMFSSKIPTKISFYPQNFLMTFLVIENCNKISTQQKWHRQCANKLSAVALRADQQKSVTPTNCRRRGRHTALPPYVYAKIVLSYPLCCTTYIFGIPFHKQVSLPLTLK